MESRPIIASDIETNARRNTTAAPIPDDENAEYPELPPNTALQNGAALFRALLAANTSNYSWPTPNNYFYENLIAWWGTWFYLEITYFMYYACNTHSEELLGRMRNECGNHALLGALVMAGKVCLASLLPLGVGMLGATFQTLFEKEINESPWLSIINHPPVSRIIAASVGLPLYLLSWKAINDVHPVKPYRYTPNPPLHPMQRLVNLGIRAVDSASVTKFILNIVRAYGSQNILHHPQITLLAGGVDQGLFLIDNSFAENKLPNPLERYERRGDVEEALPALKPAANADNNFVARNAQVRGENAQAMQPAGNINGTKQKVFWYSTRILFALAMVALINELLSKAREDKETLSEPFYTAYLLLICLTSNLTGIAYQTGVPWLIDKARIAAPHIKEKVTSCIATCFKRSKPNALTESTHLLEPPFQSASLNNNNNQ